MPRFNPYTPWFPAFEAPAREGFYEVKTPSWSRGEFKEKVLFKDGKWHTKDIRVTSEWRGLNKSYRLA